MKKKEKKGVRISKQIIPKFSKAFNSKAPRIIIYGGRGKTATSFMSLKSVFTVFSTDNCSGVIMRRNTNKIRRSVFAETKKASARLGLLEKIHYKMTVSPFEFLVKQNNNRIYYTGIENTDDIKGMVDPLKPIKFVWIEELTEFFDKSLEDGEDMLDNIEATFSRGNDDWFQMCYTFNPPRNPNHPVMRWLKKQEQRDDTLILNASYLDVPQEWLGKAFIRQAEKLKETDEELYNYIYLGQCIGSRGRIYNIKDNYITDKYRNYYDFFTVGLDIGESKSATVFTLCGYYREKGLLHCETLKEYYHRNANENKFNQKEFDDYAQDFINFYKECISEFGRIPLEVRVDHDVMFNKALKRKFIENKLDFSRVKLARKFQINDRIKATQLLLANGQYKINKNCPILIQAFKDAVWNEKKSDMGIDERLDDLTSNIDSLDSNEYAMEMYYSEMLRYVSKKEWK